MGEASEIGFRPLPRLSGCHGNRGFRPFTIAECGGGPHSAAVKLLFALSGVILRCPCTHCPQLHSTPAQLRLHRCFIFCKPNAAKRIHARPRACVIVGWGGGGHDTLHASRSQEVVEHQNTNVSHAPPTPSDASSGQSQGICHGHGNEPDDFKFHPESARRYIRRPIGTPGSYEEVHSQPTKHP